MPKGMVNAVILHQSSLFAAGVLTCTTEHHSYLNDLVSYSLKTRLLGNAFVVKCR